MSVKFYDNTDEGAGWKVNDTFKAYNGCEPKRCFVGRIVRSEQEIYGKGYTVVPLYNKTGDIFEYRIGSSSNSLMEMFYLNFDCVEKVDTVITIKKSKRTNDDW